MKTLLLIFGPLIRPTLSLRQRWRPSSRYSLNLLTAMQRLDARLRQTYAAHVTAFCG
jgi:hypothetical protein